MAPQKVSLSHGDPQQLGLIFIYSHDVAGAASNLLAAQTSTGISAFGSLKRHRFALQAPEPQHAQKSRSKNFTPLCQRLGAKAENKTNPTI